MNLFIITFFFCAIVAAAYYPKDMMFLTVTPYINNLHKWLPPSITKQLETLHNDSFFYSSKEYFDSVTNIMNTVTVQQLEKMPDIPKYWELNETEVEQVKNIWKNVSIPWDKRTKAAGEVVKNAKNRILPYNVFRLKYYVPYKVFQKLFEIYNDTKLNEPEKFKKMDKVLSSLNSTEFRRLPISSFVSSTPVDREDKERAILYNFTENWETRDKRYKEYLLKFPLWQTIDLENIYAEPWSSGEDFYDIHNWTNLYLDWDGTNYQPPAPESFRLALGNKDYTQLNNILSSPLGNQDCFKVMDDFFNTISTKAAQALPLSSQFTKYPDEIKKDIKKIMMSETKDRWGRIQKRIEKFSVDRRSGIQLVIPYPPPDEYQAILTSSAWDRLTQIHYNTSLKYMKYERDTFLMSFPNEIRMKYPLPKFLQRLPEDKQIGLKTIYLNDSLTIHQSYRKLREYLQTFNKEELRQVFRPNGFVNIPKMLQDNIDAVIDKNGKFAQLSRLNSEFYDVVENLTVRDFNHAAMKDSKYLLEEYYPPYRGYPRNLAMDVVYDGGRIGIPR